MKNKEYLTFSKRYGFEPIDIPFQNNSIDFILRIELWNAFYIFIYKKVDNAESYDNSYELFHQLIWAHYLKKALDDFPSHNYQFRDHIRHYIENERWNKVYDFFEFVFDSAQDSNLYENDDFKEYVNSKLRNNNAAYTLLNNSFIPITNETEIQELKQTQIETEKYGLSGIQRHLNSAIKLISEKPIPDYRNSIKESISMVEVISRIIEPTENTLGKALNRLEKNQKINGTFKAGFEKLYAYTNDKNGIRHALLEEEKIDLEDARFFLVSCSAFTNYLIEKAKKGNLLNVS